MSAPLQVHPASFPPVGFSTAPATPAWAAWCNPCGRDGLRLLVGRSARLDRAGWQACIAAANAHLAQHKQGGRL